MASRKAPRFPTLSAFSWSFAFCGFCTALGNLFGLGSTRGWIFPRVDSLLGLLATSFVLLAIGMIPYLFRQPAGAPRGR